MTQITLSALTLSLITATCLPGCLLAESRDGADPTTQEPSAPSTDEPNEPDELDPAGTYSLVSTYDLTAAAVLPEPAYNYLSTLAEFRDDPADTLFALLDDAGVPLVADLIDALPSVLKDRIEGWINDYVNEHLFDGQPVGQTIDAILAASETVLTRFDVVSELELSPVNDASGDAALIHRLRALRYSDAGGGFGFEIELGDVESVTEVSARASLIRDETRVDMVIGDHAFGLPYGEYAYQALDQVLLGRYGVDLRGLLGAMVDCPALAESVADRCVLNVCVGHEQELTAICEQGVDEVVDIVQSKLEALRFDALSLASGTAALTDGSDQDGLADATEGGVWDAAIDAGMGARVLPATFVGERIR